MAGFSGAHCEIDIDECDPDPCHYGTCKDGIASFTCLCQPGYTGHRCDININECQSQPCKNGGTCQDRNNAYNCLCLKGTTGEQRDPRGSVRVGCASAASLPHPQVGWFWGILGEGEFSVWCSGPAPHLGAGYGKGALPWSSGTHQCWWASFCLISGAGEPLMAALSSPGPNCEINLDDCASNPCDYGKCIDKINGYECTCELGYTGKGMACSHRSAPETQCRSRGALGCPLGPWQGRDAPHIRGEVHWGGLMLPSRFPQGGFAPSSAPACPGG